MTENTNTYPSCIKIPSSKQDPKNTHQTKENLSVVIQSKKITCVNNLLLSLANQIFGEEKWSHSVTSQTLDFVDSVWNSYVVGCCTFVKIQLSNGIFHEDVGYSTKEGPIKGEVIHCARLASYNDALTKALSSFGGKIKIEVEKLAKKFSDSLVPNKAKVSSPVIHNIKEKKETEENKETKSTNADKPSCLEPEIVEPNSENLPVVNIISTKDQVISKSNISTDQGEKSDKKISKEEMLRLERKRKQMEKQLEYKKLMREKELKKNNNEQKDNL